MDRDFWLQRWNNNQIEFHDGRVNRLLEKHLDALGLADGSRLFLPLCGKTLDIGWLLAKGFQVAGIEFSELAVEQLFSELGVAPVGSHVGNLKHYQAPNLDIFVGDVFDLTGELLGPVDAVYDRAAFVALPAAMRDRYAAHIGAITGFAPQLLVCFEYDQSLMEGPPFSISAEETGCRYGCIYDRANLDRIDVAGGLKGVEATETARLLNRRQITVR